LFLDWNDIGDDGAKALASSLEVNGALTNLDTRGNSTSGDAAQQLAVAVLASASLHVFSKVPIKELKADKLTDLKLNHENLGVTEAIVIAELIKVSGALKTLG
jgi:hypothetical protein